MKKKSPWGWIPTLYVAEGLPYFAVNTLTVLMYTNLGISKTQMAFFTGWLYLPWVIKPFWSPFVDLVLTKRRWILIMQAIIMLCMAGAALSLCFFGVGWISATTLVAFWIMAFASATHDIAADGFYMLALNEREQAGYVGVRSTFYRIASIVGQGGLVILAGTLEERLDDVSMAWGLTFLLLSVFFLGVMLWHSRILPRPEFDYPTGGKASDILSEFLRTFVSFFRKPHIGAAIAFMLLYRLPEAFCVKMVQPFLKDPLAEGGLGLSTSQIGFVNGTVGVVALLGGGIIGGVAIARGGLRRWIWPMALALAVPCIVYSYMAAFQPQSYWLISTLIGIEQFGYGFGFTAFMMYLMYFSRGPESTSHYAFCTAFMALGMMLPGMAAGWLFEALPKMEVLRAAQFGSYDVYFALVMLTTLATFGATAAIYRHMKQLPQ